VELQKDLVEMEEYIAESMVVMWAQVDLQQGILLHLVKKVVMDSM
jgi:hypothetical protein